MADFDRFARFYDLDYDLFQDDVPFYLGLAEHTGGPLLELGCGTGRLLVPLACAGFEITGVDLSEGMLQVARGKVTGGRSQMAGGKVAELGRAAAGRSFTCTGRYARWWSCCMRFRLAFIAFNSFMHLTTPTDQLQALQAWHAALVPGGLLVIDVDNPNPQQLAEIDDLVELQNRRPIPPPAPRCSSRSRGRLTPAGRSSTFCLSTTRFPRWPAKRTLAPFAARYLHRFEGELLLDKAGFALEQVYGPYDLDPFTSESDRTDFIACWLEDKSPDLSYSNSRGQIRRFALQWAKPAALAVGQIA